LPWEVSDEPTSDFSLKVFGFQKVDNYLVHYLSSFGRSDKIRELIASNDNFCFMSEVQQTAQSFGFTVTRFGEFSPLVMFSSLGNFIKFTQLAQIFVQFLSMKKYVHS
jgi:hypothetical protein